MNHIQIEGFLHLFNRGGYVLDFSTDIFDRFTQNSIGIPLCEKYGLSKGKSLEAYCQEASDEDVLKLFTDLLEYYEFNLKDLPEEKEYIPLYEKCKKVISDSTVKADNPLKQKIDSLIQRGEIIGKEEYHPVGDGVPVSYVSGEQFDQWMSEITIISERHLKTHPLYESIHTLVLKYRRRPSAHKEMMGYLRALSEDAEFFNKYEHRKDTVNMSFRNLPSNSEQLLKGLLDSSNPTEYLADKFKNISDSEDDELRGIIRELKEEGYLDILWADDLPYHVTLNNSARTYFDRASEQNRIEKSEITYIDQSIHIGDNNRISDTNFHSTVNRKDDNNASFAYRHPIIIGLIISFLVGFSLLFSFWDKIIKWIEGLFNG